MIDLNPLIKERHIIPAPAHAPPEEHACIWYSLTDEISYLPGGMVTGNISYTCCFHDLPTGLQTHCYAPMGLEIRDKWTVAGCLPGEPVEPVELGLGAPQTGLYIREDVDMRCNVFTSSFVKKTIKKSHGLLVNRIKSKAHQASAAAAAAATHQPHSSHYSHALPGGANSASEPPPRQSHTDSSANQKVSLPYRLSHSQSAPASAGDDDPSAAYPEPLRIRHASANSTSSQRPPRPDSRSQTGEGNNSNSNGDGDGSSSVNYYAHGNHLDSGSNPNGARPLSPSPYGDAHQHAPGRQQSSGGTLQGPFIAELD